eukprot:1161222-Pelagomonas_calceolata.AAC.11
MPIGSCALRATEYNHSQLTCRCQGSCASCAAGPSAGQACTQPCGSPARMDKDTLPCEPLFYMLTRTDTYSHVAALHAWTTTHCHEIHFLTC